MPTHTEDELILSIATHPKLNPRCWEMIANVGAIASALENALSNVFPAETQACHSMGLNKGRSFWEIVSDFVDRGLFQVNSASPNLAPVAKLAAPRTTRISRYTVLGNGADYVPSDIHMPGERYDYLLMSHTS